MDTSDPYNRSSKEFSEQFEGVACHYLVKQGEAILLTVGVFLLTVKLRGLQSLKPNRTRKVTRSFGKIFVTQFVVPFLSPMERGPKVSPP